MAISFANIASADGFKDMLVIDNSHWYVGGNLGYSHLHDSRNVGTTNSVNENGIGASVVGGYQFNHWWGAEAGYTTYKNSREVSGATTLAKTEHYAIDLAATLHWPLWNRWSALGKLGVAYSYAQKMAIATGLTATSNAASIYWGAGLDYGLTQSVDFIIQFAEAAGNHLTGSTDLWSIGLTFALV